MRHLGDKNMAMPVRDGEKSAADGFVVYLG
jgi:hypothetical protein